MKAGMDPEDGAEVRDGGKLPSAALNWRTRVDPFAEHWSEVGRSSAKRRP